MGALSGVHVESYCWLRLHQRELLHYIAARLAAHKGRVARLLTATMFNGKTVTSRALEQFFREVGPVITDALGRPWRFSGIAVLRHRRGGRRYLVFERVPLR